MDRHSELVHSVRGIAVKRIDILEVELPFKRIFRHSLSTRQSSNSLFLEIYLENGTVGYGEALPRSYVDNETVLSASRTLREVLPGLVLGRRFSSFRDGVAFLDTLRKLDGAKKCCLEIALLDALGKHFNKPISSIIGKPKRDTISATAVVSADSVPGAIKSALEIKAFGFKAVKVKVGSGNDLARLKVIRSIVGNQADMRVDANCAWNAEEAVEKVNQMKTFDITAVEQPVKPDDIDGFKHVTDSIGIPTIADESLLTLRDADVLTKKKACTMFNIRLSKCGGILNALKIIDVARRNGVQCLIGCHAGESGVLTAAGRHLAFGIDGITHYEGSYGKFLLKEDVTRENMTMGFGGKVRAITGSGLAVTVADERLNKYTTNRYVLE